VGVYAYVVPENAASAQEVGMSMDAAFREVIKIVRVIDSKVANSLGELHRAMMAT
jgi:hypothetical protein